MTRLTVAAVLAAACVATFAATPSPAEDQESLEKLLPKMDGWERGEVSYTENEGQQGDTEYELQHIACNYTRGDDDRATVTVTNWPTVSQSLRQTIEMNRQLLPRIKTDDSMDMKIEDRDGWVILTVVSRARGVSQAYLASDGDITISIDLSTGDRPTLDAFIDAIDLPEQKAE